METPEANLYCPWQPFPKEATGSLFPAGPLFFRPFGILAKDLEVDFNQSPPFTACKILHGCTRNHEGEDVAPAIFWDMPVGNRIQCLLSLCGLTQRETFSFQFTCAKDECGQLMELDIPLAQFLEKQQTTDAEDKVTVRKNDKVLSLRKPTGRDQREWLKHTYADEQAATHAMVQRLMISDRGGAMPLPDSLPSDLIAEISRALEAAEPLMNFQCPAVCPYCDHRADYRIDLEAFALKQLQQVQNNLLLSVHRLASVYHWSESEIFAVPPWRRAIYLKRIEMELS